MDIDIRKAVLNNIKGSTEAEFRETIEDAVRSGEEKMLPGLGVLFEVAWNHFDEAGRQSVLKTLSSSSQ